MPRNFAGLFLRALSECSLDELLHAQAVTTSLQRQLGIHPEIGEIIAVEVLQMKLSKETEKLKAERKETCRLDA